MYMELSIDYWSGRVGNNLIQLFNFIIFCKKFKIKCIQKLEHNIIDKFVIDFSEHGMMPQNIESEFYHYLFIIKGNPYNSKRGNEFYEEYDCPNFCESFYPYEITNEERNYVYKTYILPNVKISSNIKPLDNNTLVIHIRSGDLMEYNLRKSINENLVINDKFGKSKSVIYIHPPVRAYEKIIDNFNKVIIVTEDRLHPAVNYIEEKYKSKVTVQTGTLIEDIELILSAQNLAFISIFNGTFAHTLSFLSNNIQNMYIIEFMNRDINEYQYINKKINIIHCHNYYIDYENANSILQWNGHCEIKTIINNLKLK